MNWLIKLLGGHTKKEYRVLSEYCDSLSLTQGASVRVIGDYELVANEELTGIVYLHGDGATLSSCDITGVVFANPSAQNQAINYCHFISGVIRKSYISEVLCQPTQ